MASIKGRPPPSQLLQPRLGIDMLFAPAYYQTMKSSLHRRHHLGFLAGWPIYAGNQRKVHTQSMARLRCAAGILAALLPLTLSSEAQAQFTYETNSGAITITG